MEHRDLLELLYTARNRYETIHVTWEYSAHLDIMNTAIQRWADKQPAGSVSVMSIGSSPEEYRIHERIWWQKPDCWRWEVIPHDRKRFNHIKILCDGKWWHFMPGDSGYRLATNIPGSGDSDAGDGGKIIQEQAPSLQHLMHDVPIVDPAFLLATHDLEILGDTEHIGRNGVQVKATPSRLGGLSLEQQFWSAADEYQLIVDRERGILLRYGAWLDGEEYAVASVDYVVFDEPIPPERFVLNRGSA